MKLVLKGFIIGIGKIIPGVSGALLAISLGVYEKAVDSIGNFFKNPIENFKYLFFLGIGIVLAISLTSQFIVYFLTNFYFPTMLLFIGLISGGIYPIIKKIEINKKNIFNYLIIFLSFIFVVILSFIGNNSFLCNIDNNILKYLLYFLIGSIDAATMIIPGISGTAIMMLLGVYELLLDLLGSLTSITNIVKNLNLFAPYVIGIIVTVLSLSKIMSYLFKNNSQIIYCSIIGFSTSSILILLIDLFTSHQFKIYYLIFYVIGLLVSTKLEKLN